LKKDENFLYEICQSLKKPMIYKLFQNYKADDYDKEGISTTFLNKLSTEEQCKRIDEFAIFKPYIIHHYIDWSKVETPSSLLDKEGFEFLK
jgi:hypothetical protein